MTRTPAPADLAGAVTAIATAIAPHIREAWETEIAPSLPPVVREPARVAAGLAALAVAAGLLGPRGDRLGHPRGPPTGAPLYPFSKPPLTGAESVTMATPDLTRAKRVPIRSLVSSLAPAGATLVVIRSDDGGESRVYVVDASGVAVGAYRATTRSARAIWTSPAASLAAAHAPTGRRDARNAIQAARRFSDVPPAAAYAIATGERCGRLWPLLRSGEPSADLAEAVASAHTDRREGRPV